ncbi:unnamed protein product [Caenorhabditis bovis]|nr:unnamed protein product [Caenorhabditis bovis]
MMLLNIFFVILSTSVIVGIAILPDGYTFVGFCLMLGPSYPTFIAILDFILCAHRVSVMFCESEFWNEKIRWYGPLIFLVLTPFVLLLTASSGIFSVSYFTESAEDNVDLFVSIFGYYGELFIKLTIGVLPFFGYLSILLKMRSHKRRLNQSVDYTVIKQAFPIACFQLITGILSLALHIAFYGTDNAFLISLVIKHVFGQPLCIVVPISILLGNSTRREKMPLLFVCRCGVANNVQDSLT